VRVGAAWRDLAKDVTKACAEGAQKEKGDEDIFLARLKPCPDKGYPLWFSSRLFSGVGA
jgi:hypothetical protein